MNKKLSILFFAVLLIPQITSASWWNPLSWKIFIRHKEPSAQIIEVSAATKNTATSTNNKPKENKPIIKPVTESVTHQSNTLICNGKNWSSCPTGQDFVCPSDGRDAYCNLPTQQTTSISNQNNPDIQIEKCKAKRDISRGTLWPVFLETLKLAEQKNFEAKLNTMMSMVPPGTVTASELANYAKISPAEHEKNLQTTETMMEGQLAKEYAECVSSN